MQDSVSLLFFSATLAVLSTSRPENIDICRQRMKKIIRGRVVFLFLWLIFFLSLYLFCLSERWSRRITASSLLIIISGKLQKDGGLLCSVTRCLCVQHTSNATVMLRTCLLWRPAVREANCTTEFLFVCVSVYVHVWVCGFKCACYSYILYI